MNKQEISFQKQLSLKMLVIVNSQDIYIMWEE